MVPGYVHESGWQSGENQRTKTRAVDRGVDEARVVPTGSTERCTKNPETTGEANTEEECMR
jgi:hypothetical protein